MDQNKINAMMLEQLAALSAKLDALTPQVATATIPQEEGIPQELVSNSLKTAPLRTAMPSVAPQVAAAPLSWGKPVDVTKLPIGYARDTGKPLALLRYRSKAGNILRYGLNSHQVNKAGEHVLTIRMVRKNDTPTGKKGTVYGRCLKIRDASWISLDK